MDRFAWKDLIALRMERLCLPSEDRPGGTKRLEDYDTLFRDLSPVPTVAWCAPGTPPSLANHAGFDDDAYNARRRASVPFSKAASAAGSPMSRRRISSCTPVFTASRCPA